MKSISVHIKTYIFEPCTTDRGKMDTFLVFRDKAAMRHTLYVHTARRCTLTTTTITTGVYRVCGWRLTAHRCATTYFSHWRRACVQGCLYACARVHPYYCAISLAGLIDSTGALPNSTSAGECDEKCWKSDSSAPARWPRPWPKDSWWPVSEMVAWTTTIPNSVRRTAPNKWPVHLRIPFPLFAP